MTQSTTELERFQMTYDTLSKHVPGPYRLTRMHRSPCSVESMAFPGVALAKVYLTPPDASRKRTEEAAATASLFAMAPALLARVKELEAMHTLSTEKMDKLTKLLRDAHVLLCDPNVTSKEEIIKPLREARALLGNPPRRFRVKLQETVHYTIEVEAADTADAVEVATELWAASATPTEDFNGEACGVEAFETYELPE